MLELGEMSRESMIGCGEVSLKDDGITGKSRNRRRCCYGRRAWDGLDWDSCFMGSRHKKAAWVIDDGGAIVRDQGNILSLHESMEKEPHFLMEIERAVAGDCCRNLMMRQECLGRARAL